MGASAFVRRPPRPLGFSSSLEIKGIETEAPQEPRSPSQIQSVPQCVRRDDRHRQQRGVGSAPLARPDHRVRHIFVPHAKLCQLAPHLCRGADAHRPQDEVISLHLDLKMGLCLHARENEVIAKWPGFGVI